MSEKTERWHFNVLDDGEFAGIYREGDSGEMLLRIGGQPGPPGHRDLERVRAFARYVAALANQEPQGDWHYGTVRMGRRFYPTRFHPGAADNDGDLPDVGDTEFWEGGVWKPYSIAEYQERAKAAGLLPSSTCDHCGQGLVPANQEVQEGELPEDKQERILLVRLVDRDDYWRAIPDDERTAFEESGDYELLEVVEADEAERHIRHQRELGDQMYERLREMTTARDLCKQQTAEANHRHEQTKERLAKADEVWKREKERADRLQEVQEGGDDA